MTQFGDLKSESGLKALNEYLASRSYINGYVPSQADVAILSSLGAPSDKHVHCCRWYRHIKSYSTEELKAFPAASAPVAEAKKAKDEDDDDDDFDIFDDEEEEETEEEKRIREERLAAYKAKKETKPALVAKSSVTIDVKPWDDETDMAEMEKMVRGITMDGLKWGASKLVPLAYGIKKLQILCVIEDDKVSTDLLDEEITAFTDLVQSMDIAAFNKI